MKAILFLLILASATAFSQSASPEPTLKAGSAVTLDALAAATWVQGQAPVAFEPGKVYMFECWATWCGPCIAAIPHVNELHKKYYDKGLRVYGINVFEDGLEKTQKFVKSKGDGMSYPVAYTGKDSLFENQWLKPAGVNSIPHAFIVKDGKIVLIGHPSRLSDTVIEALLSDKADTDQILADMEKSKVAQQKYQAIKREISEATLAKDADTLAAKIAEFEKLNPTTSALPEMKLDLLLIRKDWPAAIQQINKMSTEGPNIILVMMMPRKLLQQGTDYPVEVMKAAATKYAAVPENAKFSANPMVYLSFCSLQWKSGDKEAAAVSAKKALEIARSTRSDKPIPVMSFERFTKSLETGTLPTIEDFSSWVKDEMKAALPPKEAPAVPAAPAE